jgi:hypothetical protein
MIKVENIEVMNFKNAIRGMRNPLESWSQSDSTMVAGEFILGDQDRELALRLIKSGTDHSKFMRQIFVAMDITAPMSWWWDFDTYKVSTTKNSTSRMHKLGTRLLTLDDFTVDDENGESRITPLRRQVLLELNLRIAHYRTIKDSDPVAAKKLWRDMMLDLPASYNFYSTWTGSYENLRNIYHARKNHKQREFRDFCRIIESLPCCELITVKRASA